MAIFNLTRKTLSVKVGDTDVILTEPSALERMRYGEALSLIDFKTAQPAELMIGEVGARIGLIVDCMAYALPDLTHAAIRAEVNTLPPEQLNALSEAALRLSGQWIDQPEDESAKKSLTPEPSEP